MAYVDGADVLVGKPAFVEQHAVGRDGTALDLIALGDQVRPQAHATVTRLKRDGIIPVLVTGDNRHAAARVAAELGIDQIHAGVLPDGKADIVRGLQTRSRVAMVGDGINDAPALTQANVGVAMGAGTDIAIESSDVIIVGNRLDTINTARAISGRTHRRTQVNVALAFGFNAVGVPAAATGLVDPFWAMLVMITSILGVFLNSLHGNPASVFSTLARVVPRRPGRSPQSTAARPTGTTR